jgi:hypothetical protein
MKVYTASGWIAASSASVATLATFEFVATSGQTVFSGNDANGASLSYVAPALIVTLNGVRLRPGDDYTATNGTSITLVSAAALNDELVVDAFGSFLVANTVDLSTNQTVGGNKTFSGNTTYQGTLTGGNGVINIGSNHFYKDANGKIGLGVSSGLVSTLTTYNGSGYGHFNYGNSAEDGTRPLIGSWNSVDGASATFGWGLYDSNGTGNLVLYRRSGSTTGIKALEVERGNGNFRFDSGYGSVATAYGCRAWVRKNSGHDGLGNGIMGSANVSSLTQQSTGRWTVNLSNAMPDTNYAVIATPFRNDSDSLINEDYSIRSTTTFTLVINNISIPPNRYDFGFSAIVVR